MALGPAADGRWYWECACRRIVLEAPGVVEGWAKSATACCSSCLWGETARPSSVLEETGSDGLEAWRARLAATCPGCGLRELDDSGHCRRCGATKGSIR